MAGALPARAGPRGVARGHGHDARAPHRIPPRGWLQVLHRAARHVLDDRLMALAAAVSFFAILSIAPLMVTALSVYGALNSPEQALDQLSSVAEVLPPELEPLVAEQLTTITTASAQVLTWRGVTGLLAALVTATTAATYLIDALTLAYSETETRGFLRRTGLAVTFVLGGALVLGALIAGGGALSRQLGRLPDPVRPLAPALMWLTLALLLALLLAVLYRVAPDRTQARWRWISVGAAVATGLWLATSVALFAYVQGLGSYETTYGSLGGVAISMFWLWLSVFLVIVGATVNAESERQTAQDSTVGPDRPPGERGAVVADSMPPLRDDATG
ncbi:YihY/virulence factor BrkB family protein [Blastococcus goldschmidtiae]|uniref:YihY/virulence factor BrkB family protein n=1 Tax=Blastococcus goldschmidtiae TaxID=3075546 RepID=A0ABU2K5D4_9ACTN|nr:YihY/virulence factor BrkB family protein [Blastococcus sp. DSM 46792]MDT0275408.1 YihY/virulence factor BrkB family protein [Blastococcus sp. DSM 46792]